MSLSGYFVLVIFVAVFFFVGVFVVSVFLLGAFVVVVFVVVVFVVVVGYGRLCCICFLHHCFLYCSGLCNGFVIVVVFVVVVFIVAPIENLRNTVFNQKSPFL